MTCRVPSGNKGEPDSIGPVSSPSRRPYPVTYPRRIVSACLGELQTLHNYSTTMNMMSTSLIIEIDLHKPCLSNKKRAELVTVALPNPAWCSTTAFKSPRPRTCLIRLGCYSCRACNCSLNSAPISSDSSDLFTAHATTAILNYVKPCHQKQAFQLSLNRKPIISLGTIIYKYTSSY